VIAKATVSDMAGYSGKPLPQKLGIKPGHRILLSNAPDDFALRPLPDGVALHDRAAARPYDVILAFVPDLAALTKRFGSLRDRTETAGALWIAWPKRSSGVPTDLDANRVRDVGLASGMVDVKVCAVDDTWSGLKFVRRLADR
jgi:hypothetical protein